MADLIGSRAAPTAAAWFVAAFAALDAALDREAFLTAVAGAGRRLGRAAVVPGAEESERLGASGMQPLPSSWGLDECGRGALILKALGPLPGASRLALASELFYRGEVRERQALLRVLAYLPQPEGLRDLAIEACRTSVQDVFEAIAAENPYPAAHFPEPNFNQMVLKAVFVGVAVDRINGLDRRITPELARMAADYAAERRAAGRPVPADVKYIVDRIVSHARRT